MSYVAFEQSMKAELSAAFSAGAGNLNPTPIDKEVHRLVYDGADNCTFVALTNIAATCADPSVVATLLTKQAGGLDFRSLYKKTTRLALVDLAASLSVAWTPSSDPFVSNPFREARVDQAWVERRNNKLRGADELRIILEYVSANRADARLVLAALASAQIEKLSMAQVHYNLPPRLTTSFVSTMLSSWLEAESSKGARLEHVAVALLRFAGAKLIDGWDHVQSHHVNDPRPHDAICSRKGKAIAVGECKDQVITADNINQLAKEMASFGAMRGYLFTRERWINQSDMVGIANVIQTKSVFGYRIDVVEIMEAARTWLGLVDLDDKSLPSFMAALTAEMDENGHLKDRRDLATMIDTMVTAI